MKVLCNDGCQQEFELTKLNTNLKENLRNDIERYYIECPNCKTQYTSYYTNPEIRDMQIEIARIQNKHPIKIKQKNKLLKLRKKIQFLANTLKIEMEAERNES